MEFKDLLLRKIQELERQDGRRYSLTEIAEYINVPQPTVSRWLSGQSIPNQPKYFRKLERLFGLDIYRVFNSPVPDLDFLSQEYVQMDPESREKFVKEIRGMMVNFLERAGREYESKGYKVRRTKKE